MQLGEGCCQSLYGFGPACSDGIAVILKDLPRVERRQDKLFDRSSNK